MSLTNAMYSGLSGMEANQFRIGTIGHNVANVNTTAFKNARTLFQTQFAQTMRGGSAPSATTGGTNPMQIGLGTQVAGTQRMHSAGTLEATGLPSDLAIQGNGFFIARRGANEILYTRDGSFTTNATNQLVTQSGARVQGFGVDDSFNIVPGVLNDLSIPLGSVSIANATSEVAMDGDLSAAGTIATQGSVSASQSLVDAGGTPAAAATALADLRASAAPGTALFAADAQITVRGAMKGDRELPPRTFTVGTDGSTLGDFAAWLQNTMGIQPGLAPVADAGVAIENGQLIVRGNAGDVNNIVLEAGDVRSSDAATPLPFQFSQLQEANGSGVDTSFTVYDSLGNPVTVAVSFVLEGTPNSGPVWRYFVESPDGSGGSRAIGEGMVQFDNEGNFVSASDSQFTIPRDSSGAATPITFAIDLSRVNGLSTAASNMILFEQNGYPPGTLTTFSVDESGIVSGVFDNGQTRTLGQVALATFANQSGLLGMENNFYSASAASGSASVLAAGTLGAGQIAAGSLESSNVDLSREFIGLITSSTGFQANSRVISTSQDLLNGLLLLLQ